MSRKLKYAATVSRQIRRHFKRLEDDYRKSLRDARASGDERRVKSLIDGIQKEIPKRRAEQIRLLDEAIAAGKLRQIDIRLYWKRTREGHQCKAEAFVTFDDPKYGTASRKYVSKYTTGGGYDKPSTAIDNALERDPSLLRAIIEAGPKAWVWQYGIDNYGLPTLSVSGKGVETFRSLFVPYGKPAIRGKWEWTHDDLEKAEVIHVKRIR